MSTPSDIPPAVVPPESGMLVLGNLLKSYLDRQAETAGHVMMLEVQLAGLKAQMECARRDIDMLRQVIDNIDHRTW
jgi:hypothetical protein